MSLHFLYSLTLQTIHGIYSTQTKKLKAAFVVFVIMGTFLATQPAAAIEVVASIRPIESLVAAVMQGVGIPKLIVQGAGSPHSYILRPSDAKAIANADIVFWVGKDLETFLIKPLSTISKKGATNVALGYVYGLTLLAQRQGGAFEKDEHEHAHENHGDTNNNHFDLHLWLDPQNAILMVDEIATVLAKKDPKNANKYHENAESYKLQINTLINETQIKLAPIKNKPFIVFHDAYHYFENRFGMNIVGSVTINPQHLPSVSRIRSLQQKIRELHTVCIFSEPQFQSKIVTTLVEGTDAKVGVLDPLGYNIQTGPEQYIRLIENLANSMVKCLGGGQ